MYEFGDILHLIKSQYLIGHVLLKTMIEAKQKKKIKKICSLNFLSLLKHQTFLSFYGHNGCKLTGVKHNLLKTRLSIRIN